MKKVKMEMSLSVAAEYKDWIRSISERYRQCQIKAAVSVNRELISFYGHWGRRSSSVKERKNTVVDFIPH